MGPKEELELHDIEYQQQLYEMDDYGEKCDILSYEDLMYLIKSSRETIDGLPKSPIIIRRKSIKLSYPSEPYDEYMYQVIRYHIKFVQCSFIGCNFNNKSIRKHIFYLCTFLHCSFANANIELTDFIQCRFYSTYFNFSTIKDSNFKMCYSEYSFDYVNFERTKLFNNNIVFVESKNIDAKQIVPESGAFIGWKKAIPIHGLSGKVIIKLQIPASAKRVGINRKCRCSKAKVLKMYRISEEGIILRYGYETVSSAFSMYDNNFVYKVGETVEVSNFDEEPNECSNGIHFFLSEQEAIDY